MRDWRDIRLEPIPDLSYDLNYVLEFLFVFAQHMQEEDESFFPFGASLGVDFKIHDVEIGEVDEPLFPADMVDLLRAGLQRDAAAGKIIASGFCMNVITRIPGTDDRIDAICAQIEHRDGENAEVYLPYRKGAAGETIYEPVFVTKSVTEVFVPQPN